MKLFKTKLKLITSDKESDCFTLDFTLDLILDYFTLKLITAGI